MGDRVRCSSAVGKSKSWTTSYDRFGKMARDDQGDLGNLGSGIITFCCSEEESQTFCFKSYCVNTLDYTLQTWLKYDMSTSRVS